MSNKNKKKAGNKTGAFKIWLDSLTRGDCVAIILMYLMFMIIAYYIFIPGKVEYHSDSTDTLMWATATFESGKLVNPDFNYACILPFGGNLLMLLFMPFFGVSYTTHCLGMLLFVLLFMVFFVALFRQFKFSYPMCAVGLFSMLFVLSGSVKLREIFWGHIIYYSQGILFLMIGLTLLLKMLEMVNKNNQTKDFYITGTVLAVFVALTATNGIQALTIFIMPLIGGLVGERLLDTKIKLFDRESIFVYQYAIIIAICMVVGLAVIKLIAGDTTGGYEDAFSKFSGSSEWYESFSSLLQKWYVLLGVDIANGDDILSVKSIFNIIKIIFGTILPIIPLYELFNYNKIDDRNERILLIAHWCGTILIMIGWIFGKISSANWRLSPVLCTSMLVFVAYAGRLFKNMEFRRIGVILSIPMLVVSCHSVFTIFTLEKDVSTTDSAAIIDLVERNNLSYGYAEFWNANVVTVLSDSRVKIRSVKFEDNQVLPYYYQSSNSWYNDREGVDRYFLLLKENEYNDLLSGGNSLVQQFNGIDRDYGYVLLIYDHNIF